MRHIALLFLACLSTTGISDYFYNMIEGFLCIRSDFLKTSVDARTFIDCAHHCSLNQRCQAFTVADGPCRLFVFDKCSKSVRDCGCTRRGQVFVKRQPGLGVGALCPSGYGDDLCGVKYKLLDGDDFWWPSRQKCESESGLVIMADVIDANEMSHVEDVYGKYRTGHTMWLGGLQPAGSLEPDVGWYWVGCNITVNGSLWNPPEPNNAASNGENVIGRAYNRVKLSDFSETYARLRVLCECVSPFD